MKKTFYNFLVDEGAVSGDDLVKAFIHQAKSNKSLPRLIKDNNLLTDREILDIYAHQASNEASFEKSCRELGFWSSELEQKLEAIIVNEVPSIFRILHDDGLITLEELTIKLDEYISNVIDDPGSYGLSVA